MLGNAFRARGRSIAQRDKKQWEKRTPRLDTWTEARWPLSVSPGAGRRGQPMSDTEARDSTARIDSCRLQAVSAREIAVCNQNQPTAPTTAVDTAVSQDEIRYFIRPLDARKRLISVCSCRQQFATIPAGRVAG
jgi:hypothetical protein